MPTTARLPILFLGLTLLVGATATQAATPDGTLVIGVHVTTRPG